MSLAVAHGHPDAALYPLGRLLDEVKMIKARENVRISTEVTLIHSAMNAVLSGKKGLEAFQKVLDKLK